MKRFLSALPVLCFASGIADAKIFKVPFPHAPAYELAYSHKPVELAQLMTLGYGLGGKAAVAGGVTWDPTFLGTNMSLSGGNLVATAGSPATEALTRSTTSHNTTGLVYVEAVPLGLSGVNSFVYDIGICNSSVGANAAGLGTDFNSVGIYQNIGQIYINNVQVNGGYASALANGDVQQIAINFATMGMWLNKNNGNYNNFAAGASNPTTGTNPIPLTSLNAGPYFLCFGAESSAGVTIRFSSGSWSFSAPSLYSQW